METKPCILVVDDEAQNRRVLHRYLAPWCEVIEADSGIKALELLGTAPIDMVLLDVNMPGQDGFQTCRLIKAQPRELFLPVVLVTGLAEQEDRNRGLEAGADDFLPKPVDRRELTLRVRAFLRLREQERTIRAQVQELHRLEALKDDMVSLLVHDLRNPLAGILSTVELALEGMGEGQLRDDLRRALQSAESLRGTLDETLHVRLLEENAITARRDDTDLAALLGAAVATLEPVARRREVKLSWDLAGENTAAVDRRLLQRSLENLLSNALKYTARGTEVSIEARHKQDGFVEIDVQDRGPGIPAPLKGVLFERFGSVEAQRGNERRGVGLGLYLVKLVAAAHGGDVSAHDRPGGGTIFRLRLGPPAPPALNGPHLPNQTLATAAAAAGA
jgi:two-component system sensor histidine kinase/response regulator